MKKNENKQLFENMEFNSFEYAKQIYDKSTAKMNKIKIGLIISVVATASMLTGIVAADALPNSIANLLFYIAVIGSVISYIVGGGLKIAFKALKKLMFFGWIIIPFPFCLATGIFTTVLSPICFFCIPVVFVLINYIQEKRNYKSAENYINAFKAD